MNQTEPEGDIADLSLRIKGSRKPKEGGGFRKFLRGTFKLAGALLLVALVLGGIAAAIGGYMYHREQSRNRPLAQAKSWGTIPVPSLDNAEFSLSTKWQSYKLYYQLHVNGFPSDVKSEYEKTGYNRNTGAGFTIVFLDRGGFKVDSIHVPLRSMTRIVGNDGVYAGLSIKDTHYMSADEYREAATWEITWSL